jgi:hypothetical protein
MALIGRENDAASCDLVPEPVHGHLFYLGHMPHGLGGFALPGLLDLCHGILSLTLLFE